MGWLKYLVAGTMQVKQEVMDLMVASCVLVAVSQSDSGGAPNTTAADLESITGLNVGVPATSALARRFAMLAVRHACIALPSKTQLLLSCTRTM